MNDQIKILDTINGEVKIETMNGVRFCGVGEPYNIGNRVFYKFLSSSLCGCKMELGAVCRSFQTLYLMKGDTILLNEQLNL